MIDPTAVASAQAAVDYAVEIGIADRDRIGVGEIGPSLTGVLASAGAQSQGLACVATEVSGGLGDRDPAMEGSRRTA